MSENQMDPHDGLSAAARDKIADLEARVRRGELDADDAVAQVAEAMLAEMIRPVVEAIEPLGALAQQAQVVTGRFKAFGAAARASLGGGAAAGPELFIPAPPGGDLRTSTSRAALTRSGEGGA
jgi:hypothetical protein